MNNVVVKVFRVFFICFIFIQMIAVILSVIWAFTENYKLLAFLIILGGFIAILMFNGVISVNLNIQSHLIVIKELIKSQAEMQIEEILPDTVTISKNTEEKDVNDNAESQPLEIKRGEND